MTIHPHTPIIIGVGQHVDHWNGADAAKAVSPRALLGLAAKRAIEDTGASDEVTAAVDQVHVVRWFSDSMPGFVPPFGNCKNPPASLAADIGVEKAQHYYSQVGGDKPQKLVNEAAEAIFAGEANTVLLAGSEAIAAMKTAIRGGMKLDWADSAEGELIDQGMGDPLLSGYEMTNGVGNPTSTYPLFENALRRRWGIDENEYNQMMAELLAGFSLVAADNPYSQYPQVRTPEFIATESRENYRISSPYLKWHVAQDAVNQGAAVILTSVEQANIMGIDPAKWIYLHGYAHASDHNVAERGDLSKSKPIELAAKHALESAGKTADEMAFFDLYSCFPCAVFLAAEALGIDWRKTATTVTGALQYFGGAGNNYSMHAIATMVEKLREAPNEFGFVIANGGFLSKEAAGVYSAQPKEDWQPISSAVLQAQIDEDPKVECLSEDASGEIESLSVTYRKGEAERAVVFVKTDKGRIVARARRDDIATMGALEHADAIGSQINIVHEDGKNLIDSVPVFAGNT